MTVDDALKALNHILQEEGLSADDASVTANVLVEGTIRGYHNHGVDRIFQILDGFQNKTLNPSPCAKKIKDLPAVSVIDADHGLGQPIGVDAMRLAIEKAKTLGMGAVHVLNAGHLGILSFYAELASKEDLFGIVMSNTSPAVVLPGTGKKYIGTNPICYSVPTNLSFPLTADFSTATVSRGTLLEYKEKNKNIPIGWAVDEHGQDTDNPAAALLGGLKCLEGGHKGFSISLLVGLLTGCLVSGSMPDEVKGTRYMTSAPNKGDLFMAFSIELLGDLAQFKDNMTKFYQDLHQYESAYRFPGERAYHHKKDQNNAIQLTSKVWQLLSEASCYEC